MGSYEYVPMETIVKFASLSRSGVEQRLTRLHGLGLIGRWVGPYTGYHLKTTGYDCLALNALVKANVLDALGKPLGVGKEADIYDALTPSGERVVVKFHRLGRTSFRQTKRKREYVGVRPHISWLYQSRLSADREYRALKRLYERGVAVPKPIASNRHVVVMGIFVGAELIWYKKEEIPSPRKLLYDIMLNVRKAYQAGIVHADLSEYNVMVEPDGKVLLIDWPQYVSASHLNADLLLRRDVVNILKYFKRRFRVEVEPQEAIDYVKGKVPDFTPARARKA